MTANQKRWLTLAAGVVFAALLAFASTHFSSLLHHFEVRTQDIRQVGFAKPFPVDDQVAVVAINEETLSRFPYRSPVDRGFIADLLETLDRKGARAIYLDILIDQPTEQGKDQKLFEAIRKVKVPLLVGHVVSDDVLNEEQKKYLNDFVPQANRAAVNLATDRFDGVVRWLYPGALQAGEAKGVPFKLLEVLGLPESSQAHYSLIDWRRSESAGESAFAHYPAHALQYLPDEWVRGKVVLIGEVVSITDRHRTPFAVYSDEKLGMMPGVDVFAHQVSQVLGDRRVALLSIGWEFVLVLACATLGGLVGAWRRSVILTVLGAAGLLASYWLFAIFGFGAGVPLVPLVAPSIAFLLSVFVVDFLLGKEDRDRRKFIQSAFSRYLAPTVVQQLIDDPEMLSIAGKKRTLSFIFTDIQGFTTLSEKMPPEQLSQLLNEYLEGMCAQVQGFQGVVDKFIGDSVMCFFNAPLAQADHADRAIACALALDEFSQSFRKKIYAQGVDMGVTRIGVHTGEAVVGNFGSVNRMDFTALGDTVNAASRIEGVNKYFGTRICVTEQTLELCRAQKVQVRRIGHVVLKGKTEPVDLFEPVSAEFAASAQFCDYESAYQALEQGEASAPDYFLRLAVLYPEDGLIQFYAKRCEMGACSTHIHMDEK